MIDLKHEKAIKLSEVGKYLPHGRNNKPVSLSCALRWVLDGVCLPGGRRVRLEAVRVGGRYITTVEALTRFALAQTPCLDEAAASTAPNRGESAGERAEQELARLGL